MTRRWFMILTALLLVGLLVAPAQARPAASPETDTYDLSWATWDAGGGTVVSADGVYALSSTAGQYDAGSSTNGYTLDGGFWPGTNSGRSLFLPAIMR